MLGDGVTLEDVQAKMNAQRPPVYVSSVTYGRMVVFTFESQYSAQEMSAALDFAYSGGVDLKGDVSVTYKDIISQSKITAFILGGDAGSASQTIDSYDALISFIKSGGNYSRQSPGGPIAYKLAYLKNNWPRRRRVDRRGQHVREPDDLAGGHHRGSPGRAGDPAPRPPGG